LSRTLLSSWRDHHHAHPHDLVAHHDYNPFRFPDPHHHHHHHYDPTAAYYADAAMDSYAASSAAAAASVYSPYMTHHHSPPPNNSGSPSIKPESAVTALQSALGLSTPMNVNVSMNFNSHNIQYSTGYNVPSAGSANLAYDPFYNANRHSIPSTYHHHTSLGSDSKHRSDSMSTKQAMLLSAGTGYDYKDFSKLCEFFPTPSSSSSAGSGEKRK
jgi:hypothetical protein